MPAIEQFNSWADLLPEALLLVDSTGVILAINQAGKRQLGDIEIRLGTTEVVTLCLEARDQVTTYLHHCSRTKSLVPGVLTFPSVGDAKTAFRAEGALFAARDGASPAQVLLRLTPKLAAERRFLLLNQQVETLSREVDRRRRAELEVIAQREQFRVTLSSIGDGVIATDTAGSITFMNSIAAAHTGWTINDAIGRPITEVFHIVNESSREPVPNPVARVLAEGVIVGLANHTVLIRKEGTEIHIDDSGAPIRDTDGKLIGAVLVFHDITERRMLEKQIRVHTDELKEEHRRKDEFLAMLGHELRNPLAPIKTALQLHSMPAVNDETRKRAIDILNRQVDHLTRLVDELLDVARVSTGKITLKKEVIEVASIVFRGIELCQPLINEKQQQLTTDIPTEALYVEGDLPRLTQVVGNLLNNAAKYTQPDGKIHVAVRRIDNFVEITVNDNGMGIHPTILPHVFDVFTQSERALARSEGGLGVGLTLVRRLVEQHGGSVAAHSAGVDQGSEFRIVLPLVDKHPEVRNATAFAGTLPVGRKILVVDDNKDAAEMLADLLAVLGNEMIIALNGIEAIEMAEKERPSIIFLDIGLPGMDGYAVANELRRRDLSRDLKIIAITGYGQEEDIRKTRQAGFDHHLIKPVDMAEITKVFSSL
jgi:PAS domain S-box-containing protein